ncbi:hypothetical protein DCS32_10670 [Dokdonia sp. Dokd-P16]|nr:hypothetical protein DCS32_10670 [Dokdonia sp. Dokd-P16]
MSTVSKALNNSVEISKDTKIEIQKYASFVSISQIVLREV